MSDENIALLPNNTIETENILLCGRRLEPAKYIIIHNWGKISSRLFSNSEAEASELLNNIEEMFPC